MRATEIARGMVTRYGMVDRLGEVAYETETSRFLGLPIEGGGRRFSEATAREIDLAVKDLVAEAHARARAILAERRTELDRLAERLLERETLGPEDLPPPTASRGAAGTSS
jgi:cell division protease FtsH